jgi:hypothetical protein
VVSNLILTNSKLSFMSNKAKFACYMWKVYRRHTGTY